MSNFSFSGGVEVLGFISPTDTNDTYAVIDPLYGIDGLRNVNTITELNSITNQRRRPGMVVGVGDGSIYYKLNSPPWNGTISDWSIFQSGSGGTFTGGTVSGDTIFTQGVTATTLNVNGVSITGDTNFSNTNLTFTGNRTHDVGTSNYLYIVNDPTFSTVGSFLYLAPSETQLGNYDITNPLYLGFSGGTSYFQSNTNKVLSVVNNLPGNEVIINESKSPSTIFTVKGGLDDYLISSDSVSDRIGIGTNTPSEKLTVSGNTNITGTLNIGTIGAGTPLINLGLDSSGYVVTGATSTGDFLPLSGGTVSGATNFTNSLSATTISATTISGGTLYGDGSNLTGIPDYYLTGLTFDNGTYFLEALVNDGNTYQANLSILGGDLRVTGGTYNPATGIGTFTNNSGATFDVSGFLTGYTDHYVTGFTYDNINTFNIYDNSGNTFSASITTLSSTTISAVTYQNLPDNVTGYYLPLSGGTVSGNTNITGNFSVSGNSVMSGSSQNVLTLIGSGNTSSPPIFSVQGSNGELFSVNDSLIGSLFSVNDISGIPIFEVFSDNTILMGSYLAPSLNTTVRVLPSVGTTNVYSLPLSAYTGAWFEYTVKSSTGARSGQIMSIFSGTTVNITETTTTSIGVTTPITFNMISDGINVTLRVSVISGTWEVRVIIRSI